MLRLTYVFIILIKFPPKKLRAVKVEQLNILSENLKEIFPPQLPGRKYVTESCLGIVPLVSQCFKKSRSFQGPAPLIRRMQSLCLYSHLLGPVSDHVLINQVRKGRALHQVIKYSPRVI